MIRQNTRSATQRIRRLGALLATGAILLGGCQPLRGLDQNLEEAALFTRTIASLGRTPSVPREVVERVPQATLGLRLGRSHQVLLYLESVEADGQFIWRASDGTLISTRNGRILRTVGLESDVIKVAFDDERDPLQLPSRPVPPFVRTTLDLPQPYGYGHKIECRFKKAKEETLEILGVRLETHKIIERCRAEGLRWRYENVYWVDATTGYVWRSRQWLGPEARSWIELEVLRPAAEDPNWQIHAAATR